MSHSTLTSLAKARVALLCLGLAVVALAPLALAFSRTPISTSDSVPPSGMPVRVGQMTRQSHTAFSITWERTLTAPEGQSRRLATSTRHQRSDGAHKIAHTFYSPDGSESGGNTYFGLTGLGFFRADDERRTLVFTTPAAADPEPEDVAEFLRTQPEFDREEEVRGQQCIVWRRNEASGKGYTEEYRAPALGGLILKQVVSSERGREVLEPTDITLSEPVARLFAELAGYKVDYSHFEGKIGEMERNGNPEIARRMRQAMLQMKRARPNGR